MENQDEYTFDIEANGLLNASTVDYMSSPYVLKPNFKIHCIVLESHSTGEFVCFYDGDTYIFDGREYRETCGKYKYDLIDYMPLEYTHYQMKDFKDFIQGHKVKKVIGHNIINYDLLACKLYFGIDYEIEPNFWGDNEVEIVDTMVLSKTLNPDRFGGHSLDSLSSETGTRKLAFRKHVPMNDRFEYFAADMLYYCIIDNKSNTEVYYKLMQEWGEWSWSDAFKLEQQVADIITRQEHRGMYFDKALAEKNIAELDSYMEERKLKAEPILPKKQATKGYLKDFIPPKNQFLKSGAVSTHMQNFAVKHGGSFEVDGDVTYLNALDKRFKLPIVQEPICDPLVPATLNDTTHIKDWLVGLGWVPSEYKDKDLSIKLKGGAKIKRTDIELDKAIATYVEQTLNSNFCDDRCEFLKTTPDKLSAKLHGAKKGRSLKVLTNPSFTKGQEKEICPNLATLGERFPYATDIVEYLTYRHRRNSILGGGAEWDEDEEPEKGYMAAVREDNRIPTPADTCGAATSRMKHRSVANVPRVTSLYGKQMRALFGVDDNYWQIGYDFDSLEAREEAHFCWRYEDNDREYCNSLLLDKPNDVHTKMSQKIAAIIQRDFDRGPAKSVKYGATYGAQGAKIAKTIGCDLQTGNLIFDAFWTAAAPLKALKDKLNEYWEKTGKKFILGIDGRKVPTRSAHAILNSLFQSAGVICAKRAMVIHDKLLKKDGLSVDFFKEDWRNKPFGQQMIAYHDEAQIEVTRSLVKFKVFNDKTLNRKIYDNEKEQKVEDARCIQEIQKWKEAEEQMSGKIWSDIKPSPKGGWFVAYSRVGELAAIAVKEAGEYYRLNVDLTAGYMIGRNWSECH